MPAGALVVTPPTPNPGSTDAGIDPKRSPEMDRFIASLGFWPLSLPAAMQAGAYRRAYRRGDTQLSTSDTLIAAVAREQGAAVLTGNVKHFPMDDLEVVPAGGRVLWALT